MRIKTTFFLILTITFLMGGCTSAGNNGQIRLGSANDGPAAAAQRDLAKALQEYDNGEYLHSVERLESLLTAYESKDQKFEQSILTVIAIEYLHLGYRDDFLQATRQLEGYMGNRSPMMAETQYVLQIAREMDGKSISNLPGRGHDPRLGRAINDLLSQ